VKAEVALDDRAFFKTFLFNFFIRCRKAAEKISFDFPQKLPALVRAGDHAGPAADAFGFIDQNETIRMDEGSSRRTYFLTGRILAVHARHGQELHFGIGVFSGLIFNDFMEMNSGRCSLLGAAGNGAGIASRAFLKIDDHAVSHWPTSFL
jgi:hypothetical protein